MNSNTTETKKNIFYTAMLILTLIITVIGTVYALGTFIKSQEEGSSAVYTGTLSIDYQTGREIYCSLMPIYTPDSISTFGAYTNTFSVTSNGTLNSVVTISLEINKNELLKLKELVKNENKTLIIISCCSNDKELINNSHYVELKEIADLMILTDR